MKKIDCLGEMCPIPVVKLQKQLKEQADEPVMIVSDHSCIINSIEDAIRNTAYTYEADEVMNGIWEIVIRKKTKDE